MAGKAYENRMDVDVYADAVVKNVLKSNPKKHQWAGASATSVWFLSTFGWATIWVSALWSYAFELLILQLRRRHR